MSHPKKKGPKKGPDAFRSHWRTFGPEDDKGLSVGLVARRLDGVQIGSGSGFLEGQEDLRILCWIALLPVEFDADGDVISNRVALSSNGFLWEAMDEVDSRWPLGGFIDAQEYQEVAVPKAAGGGPGLSSARLPMAKRLPPGRQATPEELAEKLNEARGVKKPTGLPWGKPTIKYDHVGVDLSCDEPMQELVEETERLGLYPWQENDNDGQ